MPTQGNSSNTSNRGFAGMDAEKQREIAAKGGRASHESGNAHEFTSEEARRAGAKSSGGTHEQHVKAGQQSHKNS
ncbi:MAG: hypothetical protein GAK30_03688 [Paracidovorax wautersii]|uniref:Stress-induced acidophilic repeat motif-containing protein n=1 Tax=Paracidovorax wautersii TaxID=1177982 RepID=A0A7V8JNV0_9BURK|nr:MAG: hypothetical protein GAK30_03688 [Paracidovorax wautersii]